LGCGKGDFTLQSARAFPDRNFIAVDMKRDRLWYGAKTAIAEGLTNILFLREDIYIIREIFAPQEISQIWLTFPDPYPKTYQERRRLTAPSFLYEYKRILVPGGLVRFKTDNVALFDYALAVLNTFEVNVHTLTRDLHATEGLDADTYFQTAYERKFRAEGLPIHYICFSFQ
jgi:tRNA (guanine-N7-)-methyltransferase